MMIAKLSEAMEARANIWGLENDEPPECCPYSILADAVLEALYEPGEALLDAGIDAPVPMVMCDSMRGNQRIGLKARWQAMLTAARKPIRGEG